MIPHCSPSLPISKSSSLGGQNPTCWVSLWEQSICPHSLDSLQELHRRGQGLAEVWLCRHQAAQGFLSLPHSLALYSPNALQQLRSVFPLDQGYLAASAPQLSLLCANLEKWW